MSIEKPLDLSVFRAPADDAQEEVLPYIAIQLANNQDVDGIEVLRHGIDMFSVPTKLLRAAEALTHDLTRAFEEPRIIVEGELVTEEPPQPVKQGNEPLDLSQMGMNACAVSERPKPYVRYIWREERLVRVECAGIRRDSVPTLTRRWVHIVESQLVRPGEVPEMIVGEEENAGEAGGTQVREGHAELGGG